MRYLPYKIRFIFNVRNVNESITIDKNIIIAVVSTGIIMTIVIIILLMRLKRMSKGRGGNENEEIEMETVPSKPLPKEP